MAENKIKETANAVVNKADELYNKLPLDKINEKLGGKVDVKSKKFKTIAGCVVGALLVLILCLIFCGGDAPSSSEIEKCIRRVNVFEKKFGDERKCVEITDFKKKDSRKPDRVSARYLGLKAGKEASIYSCTVVWDDGTSVPAFFVRQDDKIGVICQDWLE